jgi:peptidoglycan/LPS O-acetylase OafA/YrhL
VLFVPRRYLLRLFVITVASSVTYKLAMKVLFPTLFYPDLLPIGAFDAFGLGAILAYQRVYGYSLRILDTRNLLWAFPFLIITLALYTYGFTSWVLFFPYAAILVIHQSVNGYSGIVAKVLSNPVTVYLGKISYGLYVYHNFMPWLVRCFRGTETAYPIAVIPFLKNWKPSALSMLCFEFLLLIGIASISWFCLERPLNKLKRYFEV